MSENRAFLMPSSLPLGQREERRDLGLPVQTLLPFLPVCGLEQVVQLLLPSFLTCRMQGEPSSPRGYDEA